MAGGGGGKPAPLHLSLVPVPPATPCSSSGSPRGLYSNGTIPETQIENHSFPNPNGKLPEVSEQESQLIKALF